MVVKKWRKKLRAHFDEVLRTKTSPHEIGLGFALGTFLAILPTFGFAVVIGLLVLLLYKRPSKLSFFIALLVWNPFVLIPMVAASYALGNVLFSGAPVVELNATFLSTVYYFTRRYLVGNLIIAVGSSIVGYFVARGVAVLYYRRKEKKCEFKDVELKKSGIGQFSDGLGVFAKRNFKKGEVVIKYNLKVLTKEEYNQLPKNEKHFTHKRKGVIYYYPDPERHVNRYKNPNVYADFENGADVALRDIKKGEELSILDSTKEDF